MLKRIRRGDLVEAVYEGSFIKELAVIDNARKGLYSIVDSNQAQRKAIPIIKVEFNKKDILRVIERR